MLRFVVRRLLTTIPVMAFVALFVFSLLYIAPGDPAAVIAGDQASPEDVERIRLSLGLDRPFLVRFVEWAGQVLQGDLGTSMFTGLPVTELIQQRIEPTLSLMVVTLTFAILVAVPIGVLAAWKAGGMLDRLFMTFAVLGFSVPVFVVGYLLAYIFALQLDWLPSQGYTPIAQGLWPWFENSILPSIALGFVYIALIARTTRAAMLEVLSQDYVRTARAKGLGEGEHSFPTCPEERGCSDRDSDRDRGRAVDRRCHRDGKRFRNSGARPAHHRCHPAARLPAHPRHRAHVFDGLCARQSCRRPDLHAHGSKDSLLTDLTAAGPHFGAALDLPDILPPVRRRRGMMGFVRRRPTIALGLGLLLAMALITLFAPFLGTVDPTALSPAKRLRPPSNEYWFGTDAFGRDIYSRVIFGSRVSLVGGFLGCLAGV